jgi:hypothetical protein
MLVWLTWRGDRLCPYCPLAMQPVATALSWLMKIIKSVCILRVYLECSVCEDVQCLFAHIPGSTHLKIVLKKCREKWDTSGAQYSIPISYLTTVDSVLSTDWTYFLTCNEDGVQEQFYFAHKPFELVTGHILQAILYKQSPHTRHELKWSLLVHMLF